MLFNSLKKSIAKVEQLVEKGNQNLQSGNNSSAMSNFRDADKRIHKYKDKEKDLYSQVLVGLATCYYSDSNFEQAEKLYNETLLLYKEVKNENDPLIASCLNNLGAIYQSTERYELALDTYKKALSIARKNVDDNHPFVSRLKGYIQDVKGFMK